MTLWPFRKRSNRRPSRRPLRPEENMHGAGTDNGLETTRPRPGRVGSRGHRMSSRESRRLDKKRSYSFTSGGNDSIMVQRDAERPPVPPLPLNFRGKGSYTPETLPQSHTQPSEGIQEWQRVPTLHKRSAQEMSRRKSSKKRKEGHTREAEIKAMSANMPARPATDLDLSGRPMKKDSKRMRGGLNRNLHNPSSDISLPTAESIRSSMSSEAKRSASYELSSFHILAPRPTIRYSGNPRHASGGSLGSDHPEPQRRKASDKVAISDEMLKANKRVDELADDLSAGELRELMERDQKRRERKRVADKIKIEKRLARRQDRQRENEAKAERSGTLPPANMERGVFGRDVEDLGIGTSAIVTSSKEKGLVGSDTGKAERQADAHNAIEPSSETEPLASRSEVSKPIPKVAELKGNTKSRTLAPSLPVLEIGIKSSSSASQKTELHLPKSLPTTGAGTTVDTTSKRQTSETMARQPQFWTSFFKRNSKQKRAPEPIPPQSFSNTSRDSMHTNQSQQIGYVPVKMASSVPKRTMSRFREDLPELPISPPDSRVQSPEADVVPPMPKEFVDKKPGAQLSSDDIPMRYDTPTSGHRSLDTGQLRDETPNSADRSVDVPSPEPATVLSQSLASIDSEGSWLSGRKNSKRGSAQIPSHPLRDSASSLHRRYRDYTESTEELGIAEDEYFSRLTPGPEEDKNKRQSAGNPMPSSDEEDVDSLVSPVEAGKATWGAVGRQPTVVHREPRAKSRQGLLNDIELDSGSEAPGEALHIDRDSKDSGESDVRVHRATSVDLGIKHARHISAGSARLLDLKSRNSGDGKRLSLSSDLG